ncbi:MAG: hypothetical protein AAB355_00255 [Patescibacteria group bacterium]
MKTDDETLKEEIRKEFCLFQKKRNMFQPKKWSIEDNAIIDMTIALADKRAREEQEKSDDEQWNDILTNHELYWRENDRLTISGLKDDLENQKADFEKQLAEKSVGGVQSPQTKPLKSQIKLGNNHCGDDVSNKDKTADALRGSEICGNCGHRKVVHDNFGKKVCFKEIDDGMVLFRCDCKKFTPQKEVENL